MGRQFRYYCLPEDLQEIDKNVFHKLGGRLFLTEKTVTGEILKRVDKFSLPLADMGKEPSYLLLAPPESLSQVVMMGDYIDKSESHLIEVGRSLVLNGELIPNRFWYEPKGYRDRIYGNKSADFILWAQSVYKETKKLLLREEINFGSCITTEWVGKLASQEMASRRYVPTLN